MKSTEKLIFEFEKRGVDIIELGIPFSDPLADGPVIQYSSQEALRKGVSLKKAVEFVEKVRRKTSIPLIFMGYYNPIFKFGEKLFIDKALEAGVDGLILADLPPEEAGNIYLTQEKEGKGYDDKERDEGDTRPPEDNHHFSPPLSPRELGALGEVLKRCAPTPSGLSGGTPLTHYPLRSHLSRTAQPTGRP